MSSSYACTAKVEPMRRSQRQSAGASEPVKCERATLRKRESSKCDSRVRISDAAFLLALFVGTGAVDYMLDSPLAAVIAVGSVAYMAVYAGKERAWTDLF